MQFFISCFALASTALEYGMNGFYDREIMSDLFRETVSGITDKETDTNTNTYYYEEEREEEVAYGIIYDTEGWDYVPPTQESYLEFLWDDIPTARDSIESAFEYATTRPYLWDLLRFISLDNYEGWDNNEWGEIPFQRIWRYIYMYREWADLPSIAETYLPLMARLLSADNLKNMGMDTRIQQLLLVYDDIKNNMNDSDGFDTIYELMEKPFDKEEYDDEKGSIRLYYERLAQVTNIEENGVHFPSYRTDVDIDYYEAVWTYSFWARRYKEGNHEDIRYILRRIRQLYELD